MQGNFELIVPLVTGGLAHYSRDNSAQGFPWHGPAVFGQNAGRVDAVTLIESNFGSPRNLEVVARAGDKLIFFWHDSGDAVWNGPADLVADGATVAGVSGNPSLIQGSTGVEGDFELVVPLAQGGLAHFRRDNDAPGLPWHGPTRLAGRAGMLAGVSLIQSNFPVAAPFRRPSATRRPLRARGPAWHHR
jgi:hypothetical protein